MTGSNDLIGNRDIKLALVVDDSVMQCKVLSVLLKEEGYRVFTANDGSRGVAMYIKYQPDLVLMDINMPVMNGYEAARQIKSLSINNLAPLIFITSMDTDQAFIDSIEAGGDGILVRPFSPAVFKAKIKSIQRISDLYGQVKRLQQEQQNDAELAEQLMSGVIEARNYGLDKIGIMKKPAELFSGDIQLTCLAPNGDVFVMLGDFTGHGLRSSIGAVPLAETFRTMTAKGFNIFEIITQVNQQLYKLLPPDLFLAAAVASISANDDSVYIFNAGLPDVYIFDGKGTIKHTIASSHPALGVLPELFTDAKILIKAVEKNDRVVLISDGIVEARNDKEEMFGFDRFEKAASESVLSGDVISGVMSTLDEFCQSTPQEDDISLIDIPCGIWATPVVEQAAGKAATDYVIEDLTDAVWSWNLYLTGKRLAKVNPIPMVMGQISDIEGAGEHWQNLFTILTELYVNALDHGVLGLDSSIKSNAEGFVEYFNEREKRLSALNVGSIELDLSYHSLVNGGKIVIKMIDSGKGFNFDKAVTTSDNVEASALSGRGIKLVKDLCESLSYQTKPSSIEAIYVWYK